MEITRREGLCNMPLYTSRGSKEIRCSVCIF
ncbi:hypothetical protein KKF73_05070 [Patescibacteria group bacterium]|nr:hypothetical protein [Patescibacteria group bacterium]